MGIADYVGPSIVATGVLTVAYAMHWAGTQDSARNTAHRTHAAIAELRLSERKTSTLSLKERQKIFVEGAVPSYGLVRGTPEYQTLERVCVTGVFGSVPEDFDGKYENLYDFKAFENRISRAQEVLDGCGWTLLEKK